MMERAGSPAYTLLLALLYVRFLLNHTANETLNWRTPLERLTGTTPDISPLLRIHWWQPVYYKIDDSDFPSDTREKRGRFVGIVEHVGDAMTFKILTDDTRKVNIRPADNPYAPNLRLDLFDGEKTATEFIKSEDKTMMVMQPEDMIGRTFLTEPLDNGERRHTRIVKAIIDHKNNLTNDSDHIKFLCPFNNDEYEDILAYNDIVNHIERDYEDSTLWKLRHITAHEGPLQKSHPHYKGSTYNVMVEWETGEITSEPLSIIAADDPVTCAIYAKQNNLLEVEGWKRFKGIQKDRKGYYEWLTKPNCVCFDLLQDTSMVLRYKEIMHMLFVLMNKQGTLNDRMLLG